ncbi:iron-containing redox enzyme family protein [Terricaulis sp.]|uniref:iron-containing redox enzyme family protein n=1 Tax=Terricaulis sp. TaxID=2768686 RepID=UPI002AC54786|nr:iron-containing redox enzyme family protein [Terricaulis sp.]MDZ4690295.1 iron-containing redox enzyme family protein [Terricaulis sp.]
MTIEIFAHRAVRPQTRATGFAEQQQMLARFNRRRLAAGFGEAPFTWATEQRMRTAELDFVSQCRRDIAPLLEDVPSDTVAFSAWFDALTQSGPGQGDPLFPWLAEHASFEQMRWFLHQEVAGEAGFEDLLALTQLKMPIRPKLEMARNYWDEMGRGQAKGMHGPMLERLADHFVLDPDIDNVLPEALALGNLMTALAHNRAFAFHSVGALGVIEMTAPDRAAAVTEGLKRLGISGKVRQYFALHAVLDRRHSEDWHREVIAPLIAEDSRRARCIAEGALLRLARGKACFDAYRAHFGLSEKT